TWFGDMQRLDVATLEKLMRLGSRVTKLLDVKDRFASAIGMGGDKSADKGADKSPAAAPKKAPKTPAKSSRPRKE
ncbi:ArsR family transcriptional regulator, partial [Variovorax sp. 2RAF20]